MHLSWNKLGWIHNRSIWVVQPVYIVVTHKIITNTESVITITPEILKESNLIGTVQSNPKAFVNEVSNLLFRLLIYLKHYFKMCQNVKIIRFEHKFSCMLILKVSSIRLFLKKLFIYRKNKFFRGVHWTIWAQNLCTENILESKDNFKITVLKNDTIASYPFEKPNFPCTLSSQNREIRRIWDYFI